MGSEQASDNDDGSICQVGDESRVTANNDIDDELIDSSLSRDVGFEPLSVGYTPLDDTEHFGDIMTMTMLVPDNMDEESLTNGDQAIAMPFYTISSEDQTCGVNNNEDATNSHVESNGRSPFDNFEDLASLALQQLDDEYRLTTQRQIPTVDGSISQSASNAEPECLAYAAVTTNGKEEIGSKSHNGIGTEIKPGNLLDQTEDVEESHHIENRINRLKFCNSRDHNDEQIITKKKITDERDIHNHNVETQSIKESVAADIDRIQTAIQSIRLTAPKLTKVLDCGWETRIQERICDKQIQQKSFTIATHDIIPPAPLAAFDDKNCSLKAVKASDKLSRSASIAEALNRLTKSSPELILLGDKKVLTIDILGVDHVECDSIGVLQGYFGPFVRWLDAALTRRQIFPTKHIERLQLNLIGPCLPASCISWPVIDLMPKNSMSTSGTGERKRGLRKAFARCYSESYHQYASLSQKEGADMAVAFNAGIWGYNEWLPTLDYLATHRMGKGLPFVVTAYTLEECEDDAETIRKQLSFSSDVRESTNNANDDAQEGKAVVQFCLWPPQRNPYSSRLERETATALKGRKYYENGAWQAWLF